MNESEFIKNIQNIDKNDGVWFGNQKKILSYFNTEEKVKNFIESDVILATMFHNNSNSISVESKELNNSEYFPIYEKILKEDDLGNPQKTPNGSSGNIIHHLYSLNEFLRYTNIELCDINSIFEFGAGYGNLCKLIKRFGFSGKYYSYDLPFFIELQKYYLSNLNLYDNFIEYDCEKIKVDLFIGLWSITESSIEVRNKIFDNVDFDYCLIAYAPNEVYDSIINSEYIRQFKNSNDDIQWFDYEINHLKPSRYLIGIKKEIL